MVAKAPSYGDVRKNRVLPEADDHTILYLDNLDEIRRLTEEIAQKSERAPSHCL